MADLNLPPLQDVLARATSDAFGALTLPVAANPALVWSRFPRVWRGHEVPASETRQEFIKAFAGDFAQTRPHLAPLLQAQHARLRGIAEGRDFKTFEPLVTGLGSEHPTENGFRFDDLLGVPVLPGTGLAGLTRAAAKLCGASTTEIEARLGSNAPGRSPADPTRPSQVIFLGGWPLPDPWPKLRVELISPHHPQYQRDQAKPPGKRKLQAQYVEEPRPVAFLTLASACLFRIYLSSRGATNAELGQVWDWLTLGLEFLGFGGKTASGYGRMRPLGKRQPPLAPSPPKPPPSPPSPPSPPGGPRLVVILETPIGARTVAIDEAEVIAAAGGDVRLPVIKLPRRGVTLPKPENGWPDFLRQLPAELASRRKDDPEITSVVIAALAPIPLLVALGWHLGDTIPGEALHKLRERPWGWANDSPEDAELTLQPPEGDPSDRVPALLINLSGRNRVQDLPATKRWRCWELTVPAPGIDVVCSRHQRERFKNLAREAFAAMAREAPRGEALHVFPAMPASLAVELGRLYLPRGWPPLQLWDREGQAWKGPYRLG